MLFLLKIELPVTARPENPARKSDAHQLAALLVFPMAQLLRAADGNSTAGFSVLAVLPVLWCALFVSLPAVVSALIGAFALLALPLVLIGSPQYPPTSIRGAVLLFLVCITVGLLVRRLVENARQNGAELRAAAELFRTVFETSPNGLALITGELTRDSTVEVVNAALCVMLGRNEADLIGAPVLNLIDNSHRAQVMERLQFPGDVRAAVEVPFVHSSGRTVWADVVASDLRVPSAGATVVVRVTDHSARQAADQAMIDALDAERAATERLRRLDRSRSTLLSSISHDLRTPMTAALGHAELLQDGAYGTLTDEQLHAVNTIARGIERLTSMVTELVAQRDVTLTQSDEPEMVDLATLLTDAHAALSVQAAARSQHLVIRPCVDGVVVPGNASRLARAVENLLGNAVKFTPRHGVITLDACVIDNHAVIDIADSGAGIDPADHDRIFDRFYRAPRADDAEGSGLGLAIVRAIVEQHDGSVSVRSTPGQGATFTIRLPIRPSAENT